MRMSKKVEEHIITKALKKVAEGVPLRTICKDTEMPEYQVLSDILTKRYHERYAAAKESAGDNYFDQIVELNDTMTNKNCYVQDKKISNLKWIAARRNPNYASKNVLIDQSQHLTLDSTARDERDNRLRLAAQRIKLSKSNPIDAQVIDTEEDSTNADTEDE